ncbi:MAG: hypothetical protein KatS3mg025_0668 [Bacteroidia bacterium]|nr:MAG: hypothetical protein KatS3mg025_0668 [Bacteroidia bacterium]
MLLCQTCGHRWECPDCAITLTYHKKNQVLVCHYCGKKEKVPARCPVCGGDKLSFSGIGTERIEEQLQQFLPGARVLRLDRDTTGTHSHEAIIAAFERGKADVLVGTQMVTKGLDFERVTLVGVLYADSLLGRADFRAEERAYQLLVQLMGRAGRRGAKSHLVIQTFKPDTSVFHELTWSYDHFAQRLLPLRQRYGYPPFTRLIEINLFHKDPFHVEGQAEAWAASLKKIRIGEVLGPVYADIPRVRGRYHMKLLLKLPSPLSLQPGAESSGPACPARRSPLGALGRPSALPRRSLAFSPKNLYPLFQYPLAQLLRTQAICGHHLYLIRNRQLFQFQGQPPCLQPREPFYINIYVRIRRRLTPCPGTK